MTNRDARSTLITILNRKGVVVLDGGLATELEKLGHRLDHPLWSANLVRTDPGAIKAVHTSYLKAGADVITTASYQASYPGCSAAGMSEEETTDLLKKTVTLASESREEFLDSAQDLLRHESLPTPVIAASIGPYGAYLANGAEYTGDYGVSKEVLFDFHQKRWDVLDKTEADLFACETIPGFAEAEVILDLLGQTPNRYACISFSCRDGENISDGTPVKECAELFAGNGQIAAIGINCTAPRHISSLIEKIRIGAPDKPIAVYPNSGETYDAGAKTWKSAAGGPTLAEMAKEWYTKGARLIGGCCRIGPDDIREVERTLRVADI